jgi:hypothetical protein
MEMRLRRIPGVRDVRVGAGRGVEPVLGAVIATALSAAEIPTVLQADTPAWKIPKKMAVLPEFPLTNRGKTDLRALRAKVFGQTEASLRAGRQDAGNDLAAWRTFDFSTHPCFTHCASFCVCLPRFLDLRP